MLKDRCFQKGAAHVLRIWDRPAVHGHRAISDSAGLPKGRYDTEIRGQTVPHYMAVLSVIGLVFCKFVT